MYAFRAVRILWPYLMVKNNKKKLLRSGQEQIACRYDLLLFGIFPQYYGLVCFFPGEIFVFPAKMAVGGSGLVDGT